MPVFSHHEFDGHERVLFGHDAASDLTAIIAIHDSSRGPALGGCRFWPYASEAEALTDVLRLSPLLRRAVNAAVDMVHPEDSTIRGITHVMWTGKPTKPEADARNAVFYGDKAIDRSPCGTGTSARMAQLAARGELKRGDSFVHESIIGSLFNGRVEAETKVGNHAAIVPSIEGWARLTGFNTIFVEDSDPYAHGFQVV